MHPTLTPEAYAIERAIVDNPRATNCDNAMIGRVEQYELLTNTPERFLAYVHRDDERAGQFCGSRCDLITWTGDIIGSVNLGSGWPVRSYIGTRMYQAHARVNGREYTGRTFGEGMSIVLRETAASKRRRGA